MAVDEETNATRLGKHRIGNEAAALEYLRREHELQQDARKYGARA